MRQLHLWVRSGVLLLIAVTSLACGGAGPGESSIVRNEGLKAVWPDGETVSSVYALQVLNVSGLGTVVIDTAAEVDGGHRLEARWEVDGDRVVARDDSRPALIFAWAWRGQGRVYVAGFVCPKPTLDDIDLLDVDRVAGCGGSDVSYVIRSLEIESRRWTEVETSIPAIDGRTVNVLVAGDENAIFGGADEEDTSKQAIYQVDLVSGSRSAVAANLDGLWLCEMDGHVIGFRTSEIDPSGNNAAGQFVELGQNGISDLDATSEEPAVMLGCLRDAMVLWFQETKSTILARYVDGEISQERLEALIVDGTMRVVAQRNLGGAIAVWESHGTSFDLWQLGDDEWIDCELRTEGMDPPDVIAVNDCDAVAVDSENRLFRVGD